MEREIIKGNRSTANPNSGSLLLDIFLFALFTTPDRTVERKEFIKVNNYFLGGKTVFFPKRKLNIELGVMASIDDVRIRKGWLNAPLGYSRFTRLTWSPSVALRCNFSGITLKCGFEQYETHSSLLRRQSAALVGLGVPF